MKFRFLRVVVIAVIVYSYSCTSVKKDPTSKDVQQIARKVANWQINTFENMGEYRALPPEDKRKKWHNREKHHELEWTNAALYAGLYEWAKIEADVTYEKWLYDIGERNHWMLYNRLYHADDHAVGQMYLKMNELYGGDRLIRPLIKQFDSILKSDKANDYHWNWCDALFMAPPVWARLAKVTEENKYLDYMDSQYRKTYNQLWDNEEGFFFRDETYLTQKERNGNKLFWSRGNGWVFGGLALMIPDLPEKWEHKIFYVDIFKRMAESLIKTQREDGTWSSGLLGGEQAYPVKEISGSAFFVYGLAWGINQGLLDEELYKPYMIKGWNALTECINDDGLVGYIQPIGAEPGDSYPDYSEVYGVGAVLAAASEVYNFTEKRDATTEQNKGVSQFTTFMEDGGWCWYQDPRAIIKNGKLVLGGVSGQSGDVKIGVYDLKKEENTGTIILDKNFEVDDHDVPALYAKSDGSIYAMWAKHANEKIHYFNSSSPNNYLEWGENKQLVHNYEEEYGVTYMNLYFLENKELLYNFYRDGATFNPAFITSADQGETWSDGNHFIEDEVEGRQRPYARYFQKDKNTIGISFTDGHPRQYGNSLYYAEFYNDAFYNVNGTKIKDLKEGALKTSEAEKVYVGSETKLKPDGFESVPNSSWSCATTKDGKNRPHMGYSLYLSNDDHRFRIASWNGEKWIDREIAYAGKSLYTMESSYTGLMAFDPEDASIVYISTDVDPSTGKDLGGLHEIYSAKINLDDSISTIQWKAITSNSKYRNIRPIVVAGEGHKVLLWLNGPWNSYVNYNADVKGIVLQ